MLLILLHIHNLQKSHLKPGAPFGAVNPVYIFLFSLTKFVLTSLWLRLELLGPVDGDWLLGEVQRIVRDRLPSGVELLDVSHDVGATRLLHDGSYGVTECCSVRDCPVLAVGSEEG